MYNNFENVLNIGKNAPHREKMQIIVNALGFENVVACIPYTKNQIREAIKTDEHLNNLPIKKWDEAAGFLVSGSYVRLVGSRLTRLYASIGVDCFSLSDGVCILKEAAKMLIEKEG